jgi:50S ribosomal protein L16 3-hydroxylase
MDKTTSQPVISRPRLNQPVSWLGGMTPTAFMRRHWQKKPLLVRNAFPGFRPTVSIQEVLDLAGHEFAESRLVKQNPKRQSWTLDHGPFLAGDIPRLTTPNWTVLVQNVNTFLPQADAFLDAFRFIPEARLDDLMISVAGPGGGVGAHVDSYDVFLVQAQGQRHWEIAKTDDLEFEPDLPLKILQRFHPTEDWILNPGDLLYLPPKIAHKGTAVGRDCMTWSVGFRAPTLASLADNAFSAHLETLPNKDWRDPWLAATAQPGQIPQRLLSELTRQVTQQMPTAQSIRQSIAASLSEPAPQTVFHPPQRPESLAQFVKKMSKKGLRLHPASRLLFSGKAFFMNGDALLKAEDPQSHLTFKKLANERRLDGPTCRCLADATGITKFLYQMFLDGWIDYDFASV